VTQTQTPEADRYARAGSLLRRVYDCLSDGRWHTGEALCAAYRGELGRGWEWQGCVAQLRRKLRPAGGDIEHRAVDGRQDGEYHMILPRQAALVVHVARTARTLAELQDRGLAARREMAASTPRGLFDD